LLWRWSTIYSCKCERLKSSRMILVWAGHVARIGEKMNSYRI
jgi:hypothetical protein